MIAVTQQVVLLFAPFPPLLCIPALVSLDPSSLPPPLNKSPASEGWESSCCCLALMWLTISHNAAFSCLPTVKEKYILQAKLVHVGRWTAAASFQVDYSAFAEVCCGNTFIQLFWPLPKNQASSYCFLLAASPNWSHCIQKLWRKANSAVDLCSFLPVIAERDRLSFPCKNPVKRGKNSRCQGRSLCKLLINS